jgi:hypothetical protein
VARPIAWAASANDPRAASRAARRRSPSALAVGDAPDRHLPEHACQQALAALLGAATLVAVGVGDLRQALLPNRTKVEAVLE